MASATRPCIKFQRNPLAPDSWMTSSIWIWRVLAKEPLRPILQCWDFPGHNDYAQCNLLYFNGRGIYLAFADISQDLDDAWHELRSWLWAITQHAHDDYDPMHKSLAAPPVL